MKLSLSKQSLSRDFALFAGLIVLMLFIVSIWLTYESYLENSKEIAVKMESEATRIDRAMIIEIEHSSYLLESLGRQISHMDASDLKAIAILLRSFDTTATVHHVFSWIDDKNRNIVSSNKGVHDPVDVSDRDFLKKTIADPWKVKVGEAPIRGRVSGKLVLPIAIGITDVTGKYIGTILISMDVENITEKLVNALKENNILFSLYGRNVADLTTANKISENDKSNPLDEYVGKLNGINLANQKSGVISKAGLFNKESKYVYYELSANYPYIIMICYDRAVSLRAFEKLLIPRLIQIFLICVFMLSLLWIVRLRIISPIVELDKITEDLICGKPYNANITSGASEVYMLAGKIKLLNDYINEIRLVEEENKNKNMMLNQALETSNLSNKVKIEFLTSMSHELRVSLNTIIGFAEIIKSQDNLSAENIKQYIDDIYYAAGNLSALTDDVLALSDAENNMADMQEKPVEIRGVITSSLRKIAERFSANKLTAELKISGGLPNLLIDQVCFEKIIFNLLDNIALHSKQEDQIIITAYIEKDGKNKNFLSIAMVNSILKSKVGKSGGYASNLTNLGLPLTKALIAMNAGDLQIKSEKGKPYMIILRFSQDKLV